MNFYRQRPVVIEARQFAQPVDIGELAAWCGGAWRFSATRTDQHGKPLQVIWVDTPGGLITAEPGDWIIKSAQGAFDVCDPITFEARYEPTPEVTP